MKLINFLAVFLSLEVLAHGEGKPGPHGGHVRMPGSFHTELVLDQKSAKIYLLDLAFKDPSLKDSSVKMSLEAKNNSKEAPCAPKETYFDCELPNDINEFSSIKVIAIRNGVKGKEVLYPLPLSFTGSEPIPGNHSHNH